MKTKLIIYGITGDLGKRKLIPALRHVIATGKGEDLEIIGLSRHDVDVDQLLEAAGGATELKPYLTMHKLDMNDQAAYVEFKRTLDLQDDEQALFYMSVPPSAVTNIVTMMGEAGLNTLNIKLLMEKPFGFDLESAQQMIDEIHKYYDESQIWRIDHYLAKEMAQNIVALRGANAIFRQAWNNKFIESIDILASEKIDIEGRVDFYEETGALRDIVQGHLMQLAALTLMDVPPALDWNELRANRLKAFQGLQPADPTKAIRGQYKGYRDEVDNQSSMVETFVSTVLESTNEKWQGVPVRLTAGKALAEKNTSIVIHLKSYEDAGESKLVVRVQPDEGFSMDFYVKTPGYDYSLTQQSLNFSFSETDHRMPDAYEQVFVDAIRNEKLLFATSDEVIRSWEIVKPLQDAWVNSDDIVTYAKGTSADDVIESVQ